MANPDFAAGAFFKDPAGTAYMKAKDRRADRIKAETSEMTAAKKRDGFKCRWPGCNGKHRGLDLPIDSCHARHRGMGGNGSGDRTKTAGLASLCRWHHNQWDASEIDIQPLTSAGFDGPVSFHQKHKETGEMRQVKAEKAIGVSATRGA